MDPAGGRVYPYGFMLPIDSAVRQRLASRGMAALLLGASAGVLGVAASLEPAPRGVGTHTQLGFPPCGFEIATGLPCATCGMTTAFAHAAQGDLLAALLTQPAGMGLAVLTAMTALLAAWSLYSAMPWLPLVRVLWRPAVVMPAIAVVLLAWGFNAGRAVLG